MNISGIAAILASLVLGHLTVFQLLLAAGAPVGKLAWGGQHRILPANLRWASLSAIAILVLAIWTVLARSDLVAPGAEWLIVRVLSWIFAGYFTLNVAMNVRSQSRLEKRIMTPVAGIIAACFLLVSLWT